MKLQLINQLLELLEILQKKIQQQDNLPIIQWYLFKFLKMLELNLINIGLYNCNIDKKSNFIRKIYYLMEKTKPLKIMDRSYA